MDREARFSIAKKVNSHPSEHLLVDAETDKFCILFGTTEFAHRVAGYMRAGSWTPRDLTGWQDLSEVRSGQS